MRAKGSLLGLRDLMLPGVSLCSIKDKNGDTPLDLVSDDDKDVRALIRKAQAQASISASDVADGAWCPFRYD